MRTVTCRGLLVTCLLVASVALFWPAGAFAQASPGLDAGSKVDLVLERGRFLEPLPFDVQFYARGDAPDDLKSARGRFAYLTRRVRTCDGVLPPDPLAAPPLPTAPTAVVPPGAPPALPPPTRALVRSAIHQIDTVLPFVDANKRVFELSIDALEPNKDYCFEFAITYLVKPEEIQELAAEGIDLAMRDAFGQEPTIVEKNTYDAQRVNILRAIEAIRRKKEAEKGIPIQVVPVKGTFFDLSTPSNNVSATFRAAFSNLLQFQEGKSAALSSFGLAVADAEKSLRALLADASFRRMVEQVRSQAADPTISLRLTGLTSSLNLSTLTERDLAAAPQGLPADELVAATSLARVWDPDVVARRLTNLDARIRELAQLRDLASDLADRPALRTRALLDVRTPAGANNPNSLSVAQLQSVRQLAEDARDAFEADRNALELFQQYLKNRMTSIRQLAEQLTGDITKIVDFRGTTTTPWATRATQYISADVGLASAPRINSVFFYVGTNFYLGPVNKRAHLAWSDQSIRKRFAVLFAIPVNPFDDKADQLSGAPVQIQGVIGARPLLFGAGWRLTDVMRFTGGAVLFKVKDVNPLIDAQPKRHYTYFLSLSVDWDIKNFFSGVTGQLPPGTPPTSLRR